MPGLCQAGVVGSTLARWRPRLRRRWRVRTDSPNGQERSTLDDQGVPAFSQDHRSSHLDLAGPKDPNGLRRLTRLARTGGGGSSRWGDLTHILTLVHRTELLLA
jgi:hypothetical protein